MQDIETIAKEILFIKEGNLLFEGSITELIERLKGRVQETLIAEDVWEEFQRTHKITRSLRLDTVFHVRYIVCLLYTSYSVRSCPLFLTFPRIFLWSVWRIATAAWHRLQKMVQSHFFLFEMCIRDRLLAGTDNTEMAGADAAGDYKGKRSDSTGGNAGYSHA